MTILSFFIIILRDHSIKFDSTFTYEIIYSLFSITKLSKLIIKFNSVALNIFVYTNLILLILFFSLSKTSKNKKLYIF